MKTHRAAQRRASAKKNVQRTPVVKSTQAPAPTPALTAEISPTNILQLQRTVGNQMVMRMLANTTTNQPVIQRDGSDFGLKLPTNVSAFVTDAVAFWKKTENKDKPLEDYSNFLMEKVNTMLIAKCVAQYITTGGDSGSFNRTTWGIKINTKKFSKVTATDTVGELTADEAAEVADTIYHETRHSQQYFTAAQIMAGEGSDATAIASAISIPSNIADQAFANPIKADKTNKDMIETVKDWQKIGAGIHATYKGLVNVFGDETTELFDAIEDVETSTLETVKGKLNSTLASWKGGRLVSFKTELERLDKLTDKSKGDELVHGHTKKIVELLQAVINEWDNDKVRSVATIQALAANLKKLDTALYDAYRDHLHEKDAWAVGGAAGSEFRTQASK
jgi:hypothetical protein